MAYLISIVVFLIVFSLLILVHEWGHFFAARKCGVQVEEFGMGLPPRAKGLYTDKKGTLYSLNWIPFGGFVRMYGEDSEDPSLRNAEGSFSSKSIPARTIIILGGVLMNFLMGFLIMVYLFSVGVKPFIVNQSDFQYYREQGIITAVDQVAVVGFSENSEADEAGLQTNDVIIAAGEESVASNQDLVDAAALAASNTLSLSIVRGEEELSVSIPVDEEGKMGVIISDAPQVTDIAELKFPLGEAISQAGYETARLSVETMRMFVNVIVDLFTKAELSAQVSGPVGIAQLTHQATQEGGLKDILVLLALLSISLGAINVLPIPALDGGRFLSILFELVTRKRPNAAWEARIHAFGFVIILILIVAVTYQDIIRILGS